MYLNDEKQALDTLPGVNQGKYGKNENGENKITATSISFSPSDRQWAVCSSIGYFN
jgi:hypothetical protein